MTLNPKFYYFIAVFFFFPQFFIAQDCVEPVVIGFSNSTSTSIQINWFSSNAEETKYEIIYKTNESEFDTLFDLNSNTAILSELEASSQYKLYIRSKCVDGNSSWNGPFYFRTNIVNPSPCQLDLPISDNNCPGKEEFLIEVYHNPESRLGIETYLTEFRLIIDHTWPADLQLSLTNPHGKRILLSRFNGIGIDHYGNPLDSVCSSQFIFSDFACNLIKEEKDSLIGYFRPEDQIESLNDSSKVDGIWKLSICDRAKGDLGTLKSMELIFQDNLCKNPENVYVDQINITSATIHWSPQDELVCDSIDYQYRRLNLEEDGNRKGRISCRDSILFLHSLEPSSEYTIQFRSSCNNNFGCPVYFTTSCAEVSLRENFNNQTICISECGSNCDIIGIWSNIQEDSHDWLVSKGETPSSFTGPSSDVSGQGNYIYIESSGESCTRDTVILESSCLQVQTSGDAHCDLSFYYHLQGENPGMLKLEISIDNGNNWQAIWRDSINRGDLWNQTFIDLDSFESSLAIFRFISFGGSDQLNDVALDRIYFYGTSIAENGGFTYYVDRDGDGYGNIQHSLISCSSVPPLNFVTNALDCDDSNDAIHPGITEIPCNSIDENCNGMADDEVQENPINYKIENIFNESCKGQSDGSIQISISGGEGPYLINWNNGGQTTNINNLENGFYYAELIDQSGCKLTTDSIHVSFNSDFEVNSINVSNATCKGENDGEIYISVVGGRAPYDYHWSFESVNSPTLKNVLPGTYSVSISDQDGCVVENINIEVESMINFNVEPLLVLHPHCTDAKTGRIILGVSGGTPPYSYSWSNGSSESDLKNLKAGDYSCTITDEAGCFEIIRDIKLAAPDPIDIKITGLDHVNCFGQEEGNIDLSVTGGTPPYNYLWSNGKTEQDLNDIPSGTYSVTISDKNACSAELRSIQVDQPSQLKLNIDSIGNVNCPLSTDGFIFLNAEGGSGNYRYFWNVPGAFSNNIEGLTSNRYDVTLIDQFGCKVSLADILVENKAKTLQVNLQALDSITCPNDTSGILATTVLNGTAPFDYNWSAGIKKILPTNFDTISNLSAGNYDITITDAEGCIGSSTIIGLENPAPFLYQVSELANVTCYGSENGRISIDIQGGLPPYQINWNVGMEGNRIENIAAGNYVFSLYDQNSCFYQSDSISIMQPSALNLSAQIKPTKPDSNTGQIQLDISGGTSPYEILWGSNVNQQSGAIASGLSSGTYSVQILDFNLCMIDTFFTIDQTTAVLDLDGNTGYQLYPNPNNGHFQLHQKYPNHTQEIRFKIFSLQGKQVEFLQSTTSELSISFMLDTTIPGVYWMVIYDNQINQIIPFVIL